MHARDSDTESIVSRRRVLAGVGTVAAGGLGVAAWGTDRASAQVTMGELDVSGADETVDGPPNRIDVAVSGEWSVDASSAPEMTEVILQIHVNGEDAADLDTHTAFDATAGSYSVETDLYSHPAVMQGDLTPDAAGAAKTTELLIRIVARAVDGGDIVAEDHVEDTASLTLTADGMDVVVGGNGDVEVIAG